MSLKDDANRAVAAFFRFETGYFGQYEVRPDSSRLCRMELKHDVSGWVLRLLRAEDGGDLVCWNDDRPILKQDAAVFEALKKQYNIYVPQPVHGQEIAVLLGPLGVAALLACLNNTTVGRNA